jgi:hypothetical protein
MIAGKGKKIPTKADIPSRTAHVRFKVQSRHLHCAMSAFAVAIGGKADIAYCTAYVRL